MKNRYKIVLHLLLFCLPCLTFAQNNDTLRLSLKMALKLAKKNQLIYQSQLLNGQIAGKQLEQAYAALVPQISASLDTRYNSKLPTTILPGILTGSTEPIAVQTGKPWNNIGAININQVVYDATILENLKILKLNKQLSETQALVALEDLKQNTIKSYLQCLVNQELVNQLKANALQLENTIELTQAKVDASLLNEIELQRVQTDYDNLKSDINNAEQVVKLSTKTLNYAIGLSIETPIILTDSLKNTSDLDTDYILQQTVPAKIIEMPEIQLQNLQIAVAHKQIKTQEKSVFPTIGFYGYVAENGFGNKFNWFNTNDIKWYGNNYLGLKFNWNVNNLFNNRSVIPQLNMKLRQAELQQKDTQMQLELAVEQSNSNLRHSLETMHQQEKNIEFAKKEVAYTNTRFLSNLASAKDLIQAQDALQAAQTNYWVAYYNYQIAVVSLNRAKGVL